MPASHPPEGSDPGLRRPSRGECSPYADATADKSGLQSFTWKVRGDPNVIGVFEKMYQTEDLLSSFDAVNVSLPRKDLPPNDAWAHQDQV